MIKAFKKSQIDEIRNDINNDYYEIVDSYRYGDYWLDILYEKNCGDVIIHLMDDVSSASSYIEKEKFMVVLDEKDGLEKYLNSMLYYCLEENEGEC